jgi:biopolymer transport protein ExbB
MQDWTNALAAIQVGGWVIWPLSLLAVLAVTIVLDRAYVFLRYGRVPAEMVGTHETGAAGSPVTWAASVDDLSRQHVFRRMSTPWDTGAASPLWLREANAESIAAQIERDMSKGFWVLETIVTAAPLLGLLGTIVGMMRSFQLFGGRGLVDPAGVTGGVAQSLVATAVGLVIALFALFAFNYFSRRLERLMDELESFANARLNEIRLATERTGERA